MKKDIKKKIVISGINVVDAGSLVILKDCLSYLSRNLADQYDLIALVHDRSLFNSSNITYYAFPDSKRSWLRRLYYEYVHFKKFSHELKPYLWLSLHDITPNVEAKVLAVYCHNSSPFYKLPFKEAMIDPKFALFNIFYKYLYRINIKRNNFVIVQQDWLRQELIKLYKIDKVIVSYPKIYNEYFVKKAYKNSRINGNFIFFYPAFPRVFKNFEVICEAAKILIEKGICNFNICLTISGGENRYSRYIFNKYKHIDNIYFLGLLRRDEVYDYYDQVDCLIFSSKLESWGLPISEFKNYAKPILLADRRYAYEAIGDYDRVKFFDPDDHVQLSRLMKGIMKSDIIFEETKRKNIEAPFAADWHELFSKLLTENIDKK